MRSGDNMLKSKPNMLHKTSNMEMYTLLIDNNLRRKQNRQQYSRVPNKKYPSRRKPPGNKTKRKAEKQTNPESQKDICIILQNDQDDYTQNI